MESDSTEHGFDVVELMREKLPSYIVNRFLAAGYDSKEIITSMDVTNRKGNSIGEIEKYIERSFLTMKPCVAHFLHQSIHMNFHQDIGYVYAILCRR